jgi:hypothetical protein
MGHLEPKTADQIRRRPHYIETMGEAGPLSITRITREPATGELPSRDYEFSRKTIEEHIAHGYDVARRALAREAGGR